MSSTSWSVSVTRSAAKGLLVTFKWVEKRGAREGERRRVRYNSSWCRSRGKKVLRTFAFDRLRGQC